MNSKKIATSIPAEQYRSLERVRRQLRLKRSQAVQDALELWLAAQERDSRVAQYVRAYLAHPEDAAEGKALVQAWAKGLGKEEWE